MLATEGKRLPATQKGSNTQKRLLRSISKLFSSKARPRNPHASPPGPSAATDVGLERIPTGSTALSSEYDVLSSGNNETGADTDASIRAISPSQSYAPSSFSHSTSNSLAPTNGTLRSSASTKPTTLISLDGQQGGANRIAVVYPGSDLPSNALPRSLSQTTTDTQGITFSALPSTDESGASTPSLSQQSSTTIIDIAALNAPHHTIAHPRNNPHPTAIPPDNASMLTLASSSFAPSISHNSTAHSYTPNGPHSIRGGLGGLKPSNLSIGGIRDDADEDASVRALAPVSRRGSEDSFGGRSTWSAAVLSGKTASLRTVETGRSGATGGERWLGIITSASGHFASGSGSGSGSQHLSSGGETEAQKMARQEGETEKGKELLHPMLPPAVPTPSPLAASSLVSSPLSAGSASPTEASTPKSHPIDLPSIVTNDAGEPEIAKADAEEVVRVEDESVMHETAKLA